MLSKSVTFSRFLDFFLDFLLSQGSVEGIAGEVEICVMYHRKFSYESTGERILKIGPHLPKLSNIKGHTFIRHSV